MKPLVRLGDIRLHTDPRYAPLHLRLVSVQKYNHLGMNIDLRLVQIDLDEQDNDMLLSTVIITVDKIEFYDIHGWFIIDIEHRYTYSQRLALMLYARRTSISGVGLCDHKAKSFMPSLPQSSRIFFQTEVDAVTFSLAMKANDIPVLVDSCPT